MRVASGTSPGPLPRHSAGRLHALHRGVVAPAEPGFVAVRGHALDLAGDSAESKVVTVVTVRQPTGPRRPSHAASRRST